MHNSGAACRNLRPSMTATRVSHISLLHGPDGVLTNDQMIQNPHETHTGWRARWGHHQQQRDKTTASASMLMVKTFGLRANCQHAHDHRVDHAQDETHSRARKITRCTNSTKMNVITRLPQNNRQFDGARLESCLAGPPDARAHARPRGAP